uniref:Uncharacterized protein n=1 Tax=Alexandrium andersonii TaxID=327968 RepID=A0A7S2J4S8_9DINO
MPLLVQFGRAGALLLVTALEVAFVILLIVGMLAPCMGLHLDVSVVLEPSGPVPKSMGWMLEDAIDVMGLRPLLNAEVSLWHCLSSLAGYIGDGEATCILAFAMLAVFAISMTLADMMMLALATFSLGTPGRPNTAMDVSRVLKHISMLDVFCMGVCVVCLAGQAYSKVGFNLSLRAGLVPLVCAEALHYLTYHLVSSAVSAEEEGASSDESRSPSEDKLIARVGGEGL